MEKIPLFPRLSLIVLMMATLSSCSSEEEAGLTAYQQQNYGQALTEFKPLAEQGNALAQYHLGLMFLRGQALPKDAKQAALWYQKAAEQDNALAQANLGELYFYGQGVEQDYSQAVQWYRKAAEQGNAQGQYRLAFMYYLGRGVPKDDVQVALWCRKAAEQGNMRAQDLLGQLYLNGEGVPKDDKLGQVWIRKAAEQGDAWAQYHLAELIYDDGKIELESQFEAYAWYFAAAAQGVTFKEVEKIEGRFDLETLIQARQRAKEYMHRYQAK